MLESRSMLVRLIFIVLNVLYMIVYYMGHGDLSLLASVNGLMRRAERSFKERPPAESNGGERMMSS